MPKKSLSTPSSPTRKSERIRGIAVAAWHQNASANLGRGGRPARGLPRVANERTPPPVSATSSRARLDPISPEVPSIQLTPLVSTCNGNATRAMTPGHSSPWSTESCSNRFAVLATPPPSPSSSRVVRGNPSATPAPGRVPVSGAAPSLAAAAAPVFAPVAASPIPGAVRALAPAQHCIMDRRALLLTRVKARNAESDKLRTSAPVSPSAAGAPSPASLPALPATGSFVPRCVPMSRAKFVAASHTVAGLFPLEAVPEEVFVPQMAQLSRPNGRADAPSPASSVVSAPAAAAPALGPAAAVTPVPLAAAPDVASSEAAPVPDNLTAAPGAAVSSVCPGILGFSRLGLLLLKLLLLLLQPLRALLHCHALLLQLQRHLLPLRLHFLLEVRLCRWVTEWMLLRLQPLQLHMLRSLPLLLHLPLLLLFARRAASLPPPVAPSPARRWPDLFPGSSTIGVLPPPLAGPCRNR